MDAPARSAFLPAVVLALAAAVAAAMLRRRRAGEVAHAVFVRAPAQAVWDAYFMHVARADYRPGRRILGIETLAHDPLTIRATVQMDYASAPNTLTYAFPLYEPPRRYRLDQLSIDGAPMKHAYVEHGELVEQDGGTWLRFAVAVPDAPWLLGWIAGRRVRQNLRALAAYCEGRPVPRARPALRFGWWEGCLGWAAILVLVLQVSPWVQWPVLALAVAVGAWRGWDLARRFLAP
jgi:hypothetical protein